MGNRRILFPVALKIALAMAAGIPVTPISPIPRAPSGLKMVSGLMTKWISTSGMSALVATRYSAKFALAYRPVFSSRTDPSNRAIPIPKTIPHVNDRADVHHGGDPLETDFAGPTIYLQLAELRSERVEGILLFFFASRRHFRRLDRTAPGGAEDRPEVDAFSSTDQLTLSIDHLFDFHAEKGRFFILDRQLNELVLGGLSRFLNSGSHAGNGGRTSRRGGWRKRRITKFGP